MASNTGAQPGTRPTAPRPRAPAPAETSGDAAERRVHDLLRAALPPDYRIARNWRWVLQRAPGTPARDGESDLIVVHPEQGILVLEVKAHLRRDANNRWFAGDRLLPVSPFEQAETGKHALRDKLLALDGWTGTAADLRLGHGVAIPSQDLAVTRARVPLQLGADAEPWMVLDQTALESPEAIRRWVATAYRHWTGDGRRGRPLTAGQLALVETLLEPPPLELQPSIRVGVDQGERDLAAFDDYLEAMLDLIDGQSRAAVVGSAGTGKTVLATTKAVRLAQDRPTLLTCFNAPLARDTLDRLGEARPRTLDVLTFHELCLRLSREAGTAELPAKGERDGDWWQHELPEAALAAASALGARYRAIVVDEGQDFETDWLELLQLLLVDPTADPFLVFHDPLQALYRTDAVETLHLPAYRLTRNMRNSQAIHEYAASFVGGLPGVRALRPDGPPPRVVPAPHGPVEALRKVLHDLVQVERIVPWRIGVLTGRSLAASDVWHARHRLGSQTLWNGAYDDAGESLGLPF
ncbi:MAG: NERD domain-containing protein/DEAD/DEAH box helicase, partial [Chloroflexota bacterium]